MSRVAAAFVIQHAYVHAELFTVGKHARSSHLPLRSRIIHLLFLKGVSLNEKVTRGSCTTVIRVHVATKATDA
jgi:hypothetical protein